MRKAVWLYILSISILIIAQRSFAQNIDSIIANATNQQVIDISRKMEFPENSLLKILSDNINIVLKQDTIWLAALNKSKVNLKDRFVNTVVNPSISSMYLKYMTAYSEGKLLDAAIYFYRADYLRTSFIYSERKRLTDNYQKANDLIKEHRYTEARQMVNEFRDKDYSRLDYFLLRDSLTYRYEQLETKLFNIETGPQWEAEGGHKPVKWKFSFGAEYLGDPYIMHIPWYFRDPEMEERSKSYLKYYESYFDDFETENHVSYSVSAAYYFGENFSAGIDALYSGASLTFHTVYFSRVYPSGWECGGKTSLQKLNLLLTGQYNIEFPTGMLTYLKLGGGMCIRKIDDITMEYLTLDRYETIKAETVTSPRVMAELGIGTLFGRNGAYGVTASASVLHNIKSLDYITQTEILFGIKLIYIIR